MNETKELLGKLRKLMNLMQRARVQEFAHHDFNMMNGKGRLLSVLNKEEGLTQRQLGEFLDIRPSSVGELLRKLEANELVVRRNNSEDRRVMNVYLTDKGRDIVSNVATTQENVQANLFEEISDDQKENFAQVLEKMITSLESEYSTETQDKYCADFDKKQHRGRTGHSGRRNRVDDDCDHHQRGEGKGLRRRRQNGK